MVYYLKKKVQPPIAGCEICGTITKLVCDHDHKTEQFRGWICSKCNRGLGAFGDSANLVSKALEYLKTVRQGLNPAGIIGEAIFGQTSEEQFDNFFNNLSGGMQDLIRKAEQLAVTQELAEPGGINRKFDDDSETDKSKKTAKKAKNYILSLEKVILLTKKQIKVNKILLDNELTGSIVRETALKNLIEDRKALVKLEMIQAGIKAKEKMTDELATWEKSNSRFDDVEEGDVNYSVKLEQLANFKIAQKNISKKYNDELNAIEQTYQNKLLDIDNDKGVIQINNAKALGKIELDQIKLDNQEKVVAIENRRKEIAEGSKEDIKLQQELLVLKTELANAEIDNQIRILKAIQEVQRANKNFDAVDSIQKQIKALDGSDLLKLSEAVSFLILKREWQKVWFRNKY